jgi:signal peptidase II
MRHGFGGNGAPTPVKEAYLQLILPAASVVVLDQITKLWVSSTIALGEKIPVIPGFFNLVHVRNRGMAFGMMNRPGSDWGSYVLIAASCVAVALLLFWFGKAKHEGYRIVIGLSLILGGALGNLIDRLRLGEVIDFLDFCLSPLNWHWPAFNLADSAVTVGTLWLAVYMIFFQPRTGKGKGSK